MYPSIQKKPSLLRLAIVLFLLGTSLYSQNLTESFLGQDDQLYENGLGAEITSYTSPLGIELETQYQVTKSLLLHSNLNYNYGKDPDATHGQDFVPHTSEYTIHGGIQWNSSQNFSIAWNYQWVGELVANDNQWVDTEGYLATDIKVQYEKNNWSYSLSLRNLFGFQPDDPQITVEDSTFGELFPSEELLFAKKSSAVFQASISFTF